MTELRKGKGSPWGVGIALAAVVLAPYIGAYYWLVWRDMSDRTNPRTLEVEIIRIPGYGRNTERLTPFFAPMHWLDRRLRPHYWEWPPPE